MTEVSIKLEKILNLKPKAVIHFGHLSDLIKDDSDACKKLKAQFDNRSPWKST